MVIRQVAKDHQLKIDDKYHEAVYSELRKSGQLSTMDDDMQMFKISSLSLQQAVDLACLLMRLEMDIQQYTKNIPTVGGLIKLATIDKDGIRLITGDNVVKPDYIR